jgi:hypothetical protein
MDNGAYGLPPDEASTSRADVAALRELGRVAARFPGLLVTVPGGVEANFGWSRQYSPTSWRETVARAGLEVQEISYFRHGSAGWRMCEPEDLAGRTYGEEARAASALICARLARPE